MENIGLLKGGKDVRAPYCTGVVWEIVWVGHGSNILDGRTNPTLFYKTSHLE